MIGVDPDVDRPPPPSSLATLPIARSRCIAYKTMVRITNAQRVNRVVEEAFSGKRPWQWCVYHCGTVVALSGMSMVAQRQLASRAGEVLRRYGLGGDIRDIKRADAGFIVGFTLGVRDRGCMYSVYI